MRAALSAALLAALAFLAACGAGEPAPAARVRLWTLDGELAPAPEPPAPRPVFAARFEDGLAGWEPIAWPARGAPELESALEHEPDGGAFLRLSGVHGGLRKVIEVEPDTCYVFTGAVRANALESDADDFRGANFWFGEASAPSDFAPLLTTQRALLVNSWNSASVGGREGWQEQRVVFVTRPRTRYLNLICSLAVEQSVRAGSVDFARLALEASSTALVWHEALTRAIAARADVDPPEFAWQRERRVAGELGGEHRPAIVLLPGDRLRLALPPLAPGALLACGAGAWRPVELEGLAGNATLRVRAAGQELFARAFEAGGKALDARWEPVEVALPAGARALELAVEGDAPLVLGAPLVRTDAPRPTGTDAPRPTGTDAARPAGPNVLLVSIDTLRADHVGAYGYPLATTPRLDALAARGLRCRDASAQAPYTLPSHATLLSGQFPSVHGVVTRGRTLAAARSTSLAEALARAGWATRAFTSGGFVKSDFGLDRGFEGFSEIDPIRERDSHYFRNLARRVGRETAARLVDEQGFAGVERWLDAHRAERFFLFLHTYCVHDYDPPERFLRCDEIGCTRPKLPALRTRTKEEAAAFTPEMRAHVVHLYDAALRYTDERLGQILDHVAELGLLENTLVVVTSDHGEEFFEHGALQHGRTLYEELLRVPLVLAGPGIEAGVLERPAMLADVAPTVLALLGLARDPRAQGVDLRGAAWKERAIWSEVDDVFAHKYALREERGEKTIHGPRQEGLVFPNEREWESYDLGRDPREMDDLRGSVGAEKGRARLVEERRRLEELGASFGGVGKGAVDAGTMQELRELGYAGEGEEK